MNILVRAPNWIGDQILAYPFFVHLRKQYPNARIVSACVPWVKDLQFHRQIDDVIVLQVQPDPSMFKRLYRVHQESKRVKAVAKWDLSISLPNSFSAAWFLKFSGAEKRRGYTTEGRSFLLNEKIPWDPNPLHHRSQAYLNLLPGGDVVPNARHFWTRRQDAEGSGVMDSFDAQQEWRDADPISPPEQPYWVIAPGATADSRRWPIECFIELARLVSQRTGYSAVIVGGPKEVELAQRLKQDRDVRWIDKTCQGSVAGLWRIFKEARFTVTNESGLAHVSALCGSPTQIVCGAADPRRTQPLGPGVARVLFNAVECWPCEKNVCMQTGGKKIQCLRGITPAQVFEEISKGFLS